LSGHYPWVSAEKGGTKKQERRIVMSKDFDFEGDSTGNFLNSIAHATVREVRANLEKGVPVDARDADGNTILLRAVQDGAAYAVVKALLDHGAAVAAVNIRGEDSLMSAATRGRGKVAALLLERRADPNTRDRSGMTSLMRACKNGHLSTAKALLAHGAQAEDVDGRGWSPLMLAADSGHASIVAMLIKHGADVNAADRHQETALMMASSWGCHRVVRTLVQGGAACDFPNKDGWTALTFAEDLGHPEVVKILEKFSNRSVDRAA
jgi:ankyrin repeat protein